MSSTWREELLQACSDGEENGVRKATWRIKSAWTHIDVGQWLAVRATLMLLIVLKLLRILMMLADGSVGLRAVLCSNPKALTCLALFVRV